MPDLPVLALAANDVYNLAELAPAAFVLLSKAAKRGAKVAPMAAKATALSQPNSKHGSVAIIAGIPPCFISL